MLYQDQIFISMLVIHLHFPFFYSSLLLSFLLPSLIPFTKFWINTSCLAGTFAATVGAPK